jgi:hypothetical protein
MSQVLILLRKSLLSFWRAKAAVAITFLVPIVLIYLFGHVFGLYPQSEQGSQRHPARRRQPEPRTRSRQTRRRAKAEKGLRLITEHENADGTKRPLTEADVRAAIKDNNYRFALILPADLLPEKGFGVRMKFLSDPRNEIEAQMVNGLLQKPSSRTCPNCSANRCSGRRAAFWAARAWKTSIAPSPTPWPTISAAIAKKSSRQMNSGDFGFSALGQTPTPAAKPIDPSLRRLDTNAKPAAATTTPTPNRPLRLPRIYFPNREDRNRAGGRETGREPHGRAHCRRLRDHVSAHGRERLGRHALRGETERHLSTPAIRAGAARSHSLRPVSLRHDPRSGADRRDVPRRPPLFRPGDFPARRPLARRQSECRRRLLGVRHAGRRHFAQRRGGPGHLDVCRHLHERGRRRVVPDQHHAGLHPKIEQIHHRVLGGRGLHRRALGRPVAPRSPAADRRPHRHRGGRHGVAVWRFNKGTLFD